jgi:hypothetical protein
VTLAALVGGAPDLVMGAEYAATHEGLGRLPKLFDYGARLPYHIHPRAVHSQRVGRKPKDEAYYYPSGADLGPHPETFFGVHPWIARERAYETLLSHLERWDSDLILQHARAYLNVPGEGFHVPSGVLHAPGTALTLELQEDSDCLAMFQALNAGTIISKELLFKDVSPEDRARLGERYLLEWVDWEANGDPYFYENRRLVPRPIRITESVREEWIYYNTTKFSGKRLVLQPGAVHRVRERGVYSLLAWRGSGAVAGHEVVGGLPGRDELLLAHAAATAAHDIRNTGVGELEIFTFFGPDVNEVPFTAPTT